MEVSRSSLPHDSLVLVLDQGGHATRALVFDAAGKVRGHAERPVAVEHPDAERVEHDAGEVAASAEDVIAEVRRQLGAHSNRITAAALATQRSSIVCWDRATGAALSPVLSWQDRRARFWLEQFSSHAARIRAVTGLPLSPHYGVSKLHWCLENLPEVARAAREGRLCFGPLAAFLLFRLLENKPFVVDVANAARTLLLDISRLDWDTGLLSLFGIDRVLLPACAPTQHHFGRLRDTGIPLVVATGDQSAALFARGPADSDTAYVNVGTGAFVQRPTGPTPVAHDRLLTGIVAADASTRLYVLEGTVNGAGSALAWLAQQHQASLLEQELPAWLANERDPPLFLNAVGGLGSPFWSARLQSRFIGKSDLAGQAVAVAESIVFLLQENLTYMRQAGGLREIVIGGGLSRLDGLCQRLADLSGLPVARLEMSEMTARGAGYLAGVAGTPPETTTFTARSNPQLEDRYGRWCRALLVALDGG